VEPEVLATFSENVCQPLPAAIFPGRPPMVMSTLESAHSDGSGRGSSETETLGEGLALPVGAALSEAPALLDGVVDPEGVVEPDGVVDPEVVVEPDGEVELPGALSEAEPVGDAEVLSLSPDVAVTDPVGDADVVPSVAYAAGAQSSATGARTAVAAAAAMTRRSCMKTSGSRAYRCGAVRAAG
jgi:hypothetical protein